MQPANEVDIGWQPCDQLPFCITHFVISVEAELVLGGCPLSSSRKIARPLAIHRPQAASKNASCRGPLQRHFVSCLQPTYPPTYSLRSTLDARSDLEFPS